MIALMFALALGQAPACATAMTAAAEHAARFDLPGALARLAPVSARCSEADVARWYLRGLIAARDAYRLGGSPESLAPVNEAIDILRLQGAESPGARIAELVLMAASAAAQSEREVMALTIEPALRSEAEQRSVGEPGAPMVSAHEVIGDLWLQVHRFEDARQAYERAAQQVGRTSRVVLGLARSAARLQDALSACAHYRALTDAWPRSAGAPPELGEARAFLREPACRTSGPQANPR